VRGYNDSKQAFEVTFAGRRSAMAVPVVRILQGLRASVGKSVPAGAKPPANAQLPMLVEGAWRRRFWTNPNGLQQKINQLVAARWSIRTPQGTVQTFGVPPGHMTGDVTGHAKSA